jgi:energy-coupling factor transporter ATP-binding protein EcfA2
MKLMELMVEGVGGLPDGRYAFTDPLRGTPHDVTVIAGGPASGKTTLLEAIAGICRAVGAPVSLPERARMLRAGAERGFIEATWLLSAEEQQHGGVDDPRQVVRWDLGEGAPRPEVAPGLRRLFGEHAAGSGKMEYFPANRRLDPHRRGPMSEAAEGRARLTRDPDKYAGLEPHVEEVARAALGRALAMVEERGALSRGEIPDALAPFKEAVAAMVPGLRLVGVDGDRLRFAKRDDVRLGLEQLSEGERQGVLFALAFRRFDLAGSIVLIDEPELHVHASERVRFLEALKALGRDNQIIVATGSTELVLAGVHEHVIDLSQLTAARIPESERPAAPVPAPAPAAAEPQEEPRPEPTPPPVVAPARYDVPSYMRPSPPPVPPSWPPSPVSPRAVSSPDSTVELPRPITLTPLSAPPRQRDETLPLTRSMLKAARARGPLPFSPTAPVIRERPIPAEDDEERTVELPAHTQAGLSLYGSSGGPK